MPSTLIVSPPNAPHRAYLVGLDSLRAVAALSVCLFHFTNGALPKIVIPATQQLFSRGYLGVEIFFVISGFIIPYSLLGKNHQIKGFFTYMTKRIIRINPPAYVAMMLLLGQWIIIDKFIQHDTVYTQTITLGRVISNFLFTVPFTSYQWFIGVFRTLTIEFQFYIFIGLLFVLLFENRYIGWFLVLYLSAQAISALVPLPSTSFFHYSSLFALGGVALMWQQQRLSVVAYVACLVLFTGITYWQMDAYAAGVGLFTAMAVTMIRFQIPVIGFLGKMSYPFYLLHILVGTTSEFILVHFIPPTTSANKLLITALCFIAALISSYLFYLLVEKPMMRLAIKQR